MECGGQLRAPHSPPSRSAAAAGVSADLAASRGSASAASTRPPGNTIIPAANAIVDGRRVSRTSSPPAPGRSRTTVAAGRGVDRLARDRRRTAAHPGQASPVGVARGRRPSAKSSAKASRTRPGSTSQSRAGSRRKPSRLVEPMRGRHRGQRQSAMPRRPSARARAMSASTSAVPAPSPWASGRRRASGCRPRPRARPPRAGCPDRARTSPRR